MYTTVDLHGPVFDGRAHELVHQGMHDILDAVAEKGVDLIEAWLGTHLQHTTGFYPAHIHWNRQVDSRIIEDGGIIFGPWLEGTGSRNQTTRFKGYWTWRVTTQTLSREEVPRIADEIMTRIVAEINA